MQGALVSTTGRRLRWLATFTLVLLVSTSVPVLAEPGEETAPAPDESGSSSVRLPDAENIREGLEMVEREETERNRWLAGPEATRQRKESRYAYADLSAAAAQELLTNVFAEQLAKLNDDPARWLSDGSIVRPLDETAAAVRDDEGDTSLLEAGMPVRVENDEGDLRKVDLTLEATAEGFEPVNPLAELKIPDHADEPIEIGDRGLSVSAFGADGSQGARLLGDKNVFYPEAQGPGSDVDRIVSPTAGGVEVFDLLRSADSPEALRYEIEMPPGAELRSDGNRGAEVAIGDEILDWIPFPVAFDAQGTQVPVELQIEGNAIALSIPHRESDLAYPILLDPHHIWEDWVNKNWFDGHNTEALDIGVWQYTENWGWIEGETHCINTYKGCPWGWRGLYISMPGGAHGANEYGHWAYPIPNNGTYLVNAWAIPFWREDHSCHRSQYPQPHDYVGMWSKHGYWTAFVANQAINVGSIDIQSAGDAFVMGLHTGGGSIAPCWRDLGVGGVAIWLDDWQNPSVDSVSIGGTVNGWISDLTTASITVNARDEGLGVRLITMFPEGKTLLKDENVCTGLAGKRCPTTRSWQQNFTGDSLGQGRRFVNVSVEDPLKKTSGTYQTYTFVDRSKPEVELDGQLAEATEDDVSEAQGDKDVEKLRLPVYNLKIEATDIGPEENADHRMRSGVKDIKVFLDGVEQDVPWDPKGSCPETSCSKTETYQLKLSKLDVAGLHKLKVIAVDFVGKEKEREIEFEYFPATGMKDEYVMHYFPLPDGQGNEAEEEHPDRPELAVNVMNGNLVYREQDLEVEGPAVDLEVERYYNSQLPESEDTEWGDGWTLAQTPDLEPVDTGGSPAPDEAELLESSGAIEGEVELPTETGAAEFDPALQATLTKKPSGGFEMTDETGESATSVVFDETGQTEAEVTEGFAKVDYSYEGGELSEIAVEDPGSAAYPTGEPFEVPEPLLTHATYFGSSGDGDGEFHVPADVAVGVEGDFWVVDADNHRVQHFDEHGDYIDQFGAFGEGDGQFRHPVAIEIDADGNLWVLDTWNDRVQKFTENGTFLAALGTSGEGDLSDPAGIDVGPEGEVFVADWADNRIVVFDKAGQYLRDFGAEGSGEGQFHHPLAVEVDTQGNVWVSDEHDEQIEQFDTQGNFLAQFGTEGDDDGEFEFMRPMGLTSDAKGGIWIADSGNDRVQLWIKDGYRPTHGATVGSPGQGDGQYDLPGDVDIDSEGDIWVVDTENDRVQQLDADGGYLSQFGTTGSANGQLNRPSAIEVDAQDNVWVADSGNDRIQKFSQAGEFLSKFGSWGTAEGQFDSPEGMAIDEDGNIWVSDTWNDRVQKFSPAGAFLKVLGTSGPGDLYAPKGIDTGPQGEVFVADHEHHRVAVFDGEGDYLRSFGVAGNGLGQFRYPNSVEIDSQGHVWVADEPNERILQFNLQGEYITHFGGEGTEEAEFELVNPAGIATEPEGAIWIADSGNNRLQRWERPPAPPSDEELLDDDPEVQVEVANDLVTSVEGDEAGTHSYEHEGDFLVSHDGPQGETTYEKDEAGRLAKVTLPNGTWASIAYYPDGRASSVTVAPEGSNAKTTYFYYQDAPTRRSIVDLPNDPNVTYDIGDDGSVLKWWNTEKPPEIEVAGTLWDFREKPGELWSGNHELHVEAESTEGIASIQIIANGDHLVDEETCEEDHETPEIECKKEENLWVTHTNNHAPGYLYLEILVVDQSENSTSERFWVDIPEPPPPPAPGTPVAPTFEEIAEFREEYGLEVVFPLKNETELAERINNLIGYWHNPHTPLGAVARASWERWGVPLRPEDVAEMEYRERYLARNGPIITQWGEGFHPATYAGYYMDHRAGGKIRAGWTAGQESQVSALKEVSGIVASDRLTGFVTQPNWSLAQLRSISRDFDTKVVSRPDILALLATARLDVKENKVALGATSTGPLNTYLASEFGSTSALGTFFVPSKPTLRTESCLDEFGPRVRAAGSSRLYSGDWIRRTPGHCGCTLGFGVWEEGAPKPNGERPMFRYALTAGHCWGLGMEIRRAGYAINKDTGKKVEDVTGPFGTVVRRSNPHVHEGFMTDAEAILLDRTTEIPRWIYMDGFQQMANGVSDWVPGQTLCYSGALGRPETRGIPNCGPTRRELAKEYYDGEAHPPTWQITLRAWGKGGDSGGPVWNPVTGAGVGLVTGGPPEGAPTLVTPLLSLENRDDLPEVGSGTAPGVLAAPGMKGANPWYIVDPVK